jgi:hypothetical protein
MSKLLTVMADHLALTNVGKRALALTGTPDVFRRKPSPRIVVGLVLIALSYVIGWPMVAACGMLAAYLGEPLILAIGGPVAYGLAWVVFLIGMFIIGAESYTVGRQYGGYLLKCFIERYRSEQEKRSSEIASGSSSNSSSTKE